MAKGKIVKLHENGFSGMIEPDGGGKWVYFQIKLAKNAPAGGVKVGVHVSFESEMTNKGPRAKWVNCLSESTATADQKEVQPTKTQGYRFLNPYNFVRWLLPPSEKTPEVKPVTALASALRAAGLNKKEPSRTPVSHEIQLLDKCAPPPHDRWVGLSGRIECRAVAVTPVFVSDSEKVMPDSEKPKHKHYQFFRVGDKKVIPASSLRGPVRSVFEAITNSCFSTFAANKRLSYRLDAREARFLVPARIEKIEDEKKKENRWALRLLTGTAQLDVNYPPKKLYPASVRQYRARIPSGKRPQSSPPPVVDLQSLGSSQEWHGKECCAVLIENEFGWRVSKVARDLTTANRLKDELAQNEGRSKSVIVERGWLCMTNQNNDNKQSERFFFVQNHQDWPETIPLEDQVRKNYQDLITDYQDRHAHTVKQWREDGNDPGQPSGLEMAFSRFILNWDEREVKGGELVYAMLHGRGANLQARFIAPVSVPRVAYDHTVGQLLPERLHRCKSEKGLCPACRTFGWVQGETEGAYAGRVRFSDAELAEEKPGTSMRLAILGSPKPTTSRFYLFAPNGQPSSNQREDKEAGYDGNEGNNLLRGRKMYRHHQPVPEVLHVETRSDQNRTLKDPEEAGAVFMFSVAFENLAAVELGALLWALEVGKQGYHRLGYGKPLGLGSLAVTVSDLRLRNPAERYASLTNAGWSASLSEEERNKFVYAFQRAIVQRLRPDIFGDNKTDWRSLFADLPNIQDLLALIGRKEPLLPVHYPKSPDRDSKGQFEWFVGNKRLKGPKLELALPAEDEGLPLVDKQGNVR